MSNIEITDEVLTKFENLIIKAENYINENAFKFLNNDQSFAKVRQLIQYKYQPTHNIFKDNKIIDSNSVKDKIIERLCIQLQNYQARPIVINYKSFDYVKDFKKSNVILEIFKKCLSDNYETRTDRVKVIYNNLLEKLDFDEEKNTPAQAEKYIPKEKYNYVWYVYARGLSDCIEYLTKPRNFKNKEYQNGFRLIEYFAQEIKNSGSYEVIKDLGLRKNFYNNIYYLGKALTYDFFKELGCTNLVKPDVHIIQLFKSCKFVENNAKEDEVFDTFTKLCIKYNDKYPNDMLTPYYIDKILWLCCTGAFYEDGIIVTNMTRNNFIKYIK